MADLETLGVKVQRRFLLGTGEETSAPERAQLTELAFTLPKVLEVRATFASESLGTKLLKIFKKEIQTGDPLFDEAVNIKTETPEATAALLASRDLCAAIESLITSGGAIEIDGAFVKLAMPGHRPGTDDATLTLVRELIA